MHFSEEEKNINRKDLPSKIPVPKSHQGYVYIVAMW